MHLKKSYILLISIMACLRLAAQDSITVHSVDSMLQVVIMHVPDTLMPSQDTSGVSDAHPQDSPSETGFLIITPDGTSQLRIRGSIRMNGGIDLNGLQSTESFQTYDIPVGDDNRSETRFFLGARQSRIGLEASKNTNKNPILMRIEGDFYGSGNTLRLRHAYGSYDDYLVGQTWSAFSDPLAIPWTVDFEGPNSSVLERTVQIRYSTVFRNDYRFTASVEAPSVEVNPNDSINQSFQSVPDVITRIRKSKTWGHWQASALFRNINVNNLQGEQSTLFGYGLLATGRLNISQNKHVLYQLVAGQGIAKYINGLSGRGLDIIYNPLDDTYETLPVIGGYISLGVNWTDNLFSFFTPGFTKAVNTEYQEDDAFSFSGYFSGNIFIDIIEGLRAGGEYSWGSRINKDGQYGFANRISFIVYYDF